MTNQPAKQPAYRRIVLKLSGEVFGGRRASGLDGAVLRRVAKEIARAAALDAQLGIVIGGGNFFRGARNELAPIARTTGDDIGMLATAMNALAFRDFLRHAGLKAEALSAIEMPKIMDRFSVRRAEELFAQGATLIFAGGTGNPHFTTDTAAALRAAEIGADLLLKATNVDGVYSEDPSKNPKAKRFERLSYAQCLNKRLGVMDMTAFELCQSNKIPIIVFNLTQAGGIERAIAGEAIGTYVGG
ncbi:UMP kinase [Candidatus Sumerlaeota bacterium]|nr:UMP kinase [Candidatus Sumerlaeota bacterium]